MGTNKKGKASISFSINETTKPRINASQIRINATSRMMNAGLPKPTRKLTVGRSGKIGYSK